jgi:hypothetical protein
MDEPDEDEGLVELKDVAGRGADSQLRYSQNPAEKGNGNGMEGFEGIVGVGAGGKNKAYAQNPKSAIFGKKEFTKPKKPTVNEAEKKDTGPPLSLGVFGSGMQKK